jgi:hypothetical protein
VPDRITLDEGRRVLNHLGYFGRGGAVRLADAYLYRGDPPPGWPPAILYGLVDIRRTIPAAAFIAYLVYHGIDGEAAEAALQDVLAGS